MYFRVLDDQGEVIDVTNNAQSRVSVKNALLSHLCPQVCDADLSDLAAGSLTDLLKTQGYTIEQDDQPFSGQDYDYDGEVNWEWNGRCVAY